MDRLAAGLRMIDARDPRYASRDRRDARTMRTIPPKMSTNLHFIDPMHQFHSDHYLRHNARRLEHLASLELDVRVQRYLKSVLVSVMILITIWIVNARS